MLTAAIGARGCGEARTRGGVYAESGLSPNGLPIEHFCIDPAIPLPPGLDLANKTQLWKHPETGIIHLLIWVGKTHYPYVADYLEECRRMGASRKLNPNLDLSQLTPGESMMVMAHPRARNTHWQDMALPATCAKITACRCPRCRDLALPHDPDHVDAAHPAEGPCLFKTYELIPADAGMPLITGNEDGALAEVPYLRTIGSTAYVYTPHGERADGLEPGIFAMLPLTGFALVRRDDGSVNETAKAKLADTAWEVYETDQ